MSGIREFGGGGDRSGGRSKVKKMSESEWL